MIWKQNPKSGRIILDPTDTDVENLRIDRDTVFGVQNIKSEEAIIDIAPQDLSFPLLVSSKRSAHFRSKLIALARKYGAVFDGSFSEIKCDPVKVNFTSKPPESVRFVPLQPNLQNVMRLKIQKLLDKNIVSKTTEKANCSLMLVPKPNLAEGTSRLAPEAWRLVNDLVKLNRHVEPFQYHTPAVLDLLNSLSGSKMFVKLDLPDAYFLLKIR